jgi:hypothetical protein
MAKQLPVKGKTLLVLSTNTSGGLKPGQRAEVDDTPYTRGLLRSGLWQLLVPVAAPVIDVEEDHGTQGDPLPE